MGQDSDQSTEGPETSRGAEVADRLKRMGLAPTVPSMGAVAQPGKNDSIEIRLDRLSAFAHSAGPKIEWMYGVVKNLHADDPSAQLRAVHADVRHLHVDMTELKEAAEQQRTDDRRAKATFDEELKSIREIQTQILDKLDDVLRANKRETGYSHIALSRSVPERTRSSEHEFNLEDEEPLSGDDDNE